MYNCFEQQVHTKEHVNKLSNYVIKVIKCLEFSGLQACVNALEEAVLL